MHTYMGIYSAYSDNYTRWSCSFGITSLYLRMYFHTDTFIYTCGYIFHTGDEQMKRDVASSLVANAALTGPVLAAAASQQQQKQHSTIV